MTVIKFIAVITQSWYSPTTVFLLWNIFILYIFICINTHIYIPPLILYLPQKRRISRSTHCRATNPICFWTAYSWRVSLFWSHSISFTLCWERAKKHFYPLILWYFIHCIVAVSQFFWGIKIFLDAQKQK